VIKLNRFGGLSNEQLRAVNAECDEFERSLLGQQRISIENLIAAAPNPIRAPLFEELLAIEFEFLLARQEPPPHCGFRGSIP